LRRLVQDAHLRWLRPPRAQPNFFQKSVRAGGNRMLPCRRRTPAPKRGLRFSYRTTTDPARLERLNHHEEQNVAFLAALYGPARRGRRGGAPPEDRARQLSGEQGIEASCSRCQRWLRPSRAEPNFFQKSVRAGERGNRMLPCRRRTPDLRPHRMKLVGMGAPAPTLVDLCNNADTLASFQRPVE
jgi:hypothetical protein